MLETVLKIQSKKIREVTNIIKAQPTNTKYGWELSIDDESLSFPDAVEQLAVYVENSLLKLREIGIDRHDITLWIYYEYYQQCNFELHPKELKRISDLGIVLCVSCWQKGSEMVLG